MKVLSDIKDSKADFVLELLNSLSFVKVKPLTSKKEQFLKELKEAVEEVKLAKAGKIKTRSIKELLNELKVDSILF